MSKRRLGGQLSWVVVGRILAALVQAVTFIVLAAAISPREFGLFAAAFGLATLAQTAVDLGLATLVLRERAKDRENGIVTSALRLNNRLSLVLGLVVTVAVAVAASLINDFYWFLLPLAVWAGSERNADTWLGVVFADGDVPITTSNLVLRRIAALGLFLMMSAAALHPVLAFAIAIATAAIASSVFARTFVARRLPPRVDVRAIELVRLSWPYWLNSVATQARNIDVTLTALLAGAVQGGYYGLATRLVGPLQILPTSLASLLLPIAARRGRASLSGTVRLIGACMTGLGVLYGSLVLLVPLAVHQFLPSYAGAVFTIQIATSGLFFASAATLIGSVLQGVGLKHYVANVAVLTTLVCLIGVLIGASVEGAVGASFALAVGFVVQSTFLGLRLWMFVSRKEPNR